MNFSWRISLSLGLSYDTSLPSPSQPFKSNSCVCNTVLLVKSSVSWKKLFWKCGAFYLETNAFFGFGELLNLGQICSGFGALHLFDQRNSAKIHCSCYKHFKNFQWFIVLNSNNAHTGECDRDRRWRSRRLRQTDEQPYRGVDFNYATTVILSRAIEKHLREYWSGLVGLIHLAWLKFSYKK